MTRSAKNIEYKLNDTHIQLLCDEIRRLKSESNKNPMIRKLRKKVKKLQGQLEVQMNNNKVLNKRNQQLAKENKEYQGKLLNK